jgi:acyl carrier protein phosphodiesterase
MNWLAHLFLSQPQVEVRLGNILADLVKGKERVTLNSRFDRVKIKTTPNPLYWTDTAKIVQYVKQHKQTIICVHLWTFLTH